MKIMKKVFLVVCLAMFSIASFAQIGGWNVKSGLNISTITKEANSDAKVGFKIGGGMEYAFCESFAVQPSIFLSTKGAKLQDAVYDVTMNAVYLEMPILAVYKMNLSERAKLLINAGPYFANGIGGKITSADSDKELDTFGENGQIRRLDIGAQVGLGAEFGHILVGFDAQFGLVKFSDKFDSKNQNFSFVVGYKF